MCKVVIVVRFLLAALVYLTAFGVASADPSGADQPEDQAEPRILAIGDSLMSWHTLTGLSIPDIVEQELEEPVANRSIGGARLIFKVPLFGDVGMQISHQVIDGDWDWVVMNGGGNDLWFGCGCNKCDAKMDKLITSDGEDGEIPRVINGLLDNGSKVLFFGYLRSPGIGSMIEECRDEGDELETRIETFANANKGVYFMSNADLVPEGDLSFHALDRIHPSLKASEAIGNRVAAFIRKYDRNR